MLTDSDRRQVIELRIDNAHQTMQEAKLLMNNGFWNAAINRMYYISFDRNTVDTLFPQAELFISTVESLISTDG